MGEFGTNRMRRMGDERTTAPDWYTPHPTRIPHTKQTSKNKKHPRQATRQRKSIK